MQFENVLPLVLEAEGVYSNDPDDAGGETVFGLDQKDDASWSGWADVHRLQAAGTPMGQWSKDTALMAAVSAYYKARYWDPAQLDYFPPALQAACFGCAVNQGIEKMVRLMQETLNECHAPTTVDGVLGPATLTAINEAASPAYLADTFWILRAKSYVADVDAKPSQEKFLLGWMHRLINGL